MINGIYDWKQKFVLLIVSLFVLACVIYYPSISKGCYSHWRKTAFIKLQIKNVRGY